MKHTTKVLCVLLALLMAFSFTSLAANSFAVNGGGNGSGGGNGDKKLEIKAVTVDGTPIEEADVGTGSTITIVFTNGMTDYADANTRQINIVSADGTQQTFSVTPPDRNGEDDAKRTYTVLLGFIDPGEYKLVLGADLKANNGNTLGTDVEYAFTVKDEEPDQPAAATFLQRVQAFFNGLIEKFMAFVRAITNNSYVSIFTVLKNTLITLFNRLFPKVA